MANAQLLPEVVKLLDEGHTVTLPLRGYSMRPFLENERDKALLKKTTTISMGDAVLAELSKGHYVLHRVVGIDGDAITLRGDGNLSNEYCHAGDVKATAIAFYRKGRSTPDSTSGRKWRVYSWLWTRLFPLRRYLLAFYRRIWLKFFKPI
jgi:hypothetical protein